MTHDEMNGLLDIPEAEVQDGSALPEYVEPARFTVTRTVEGPAGAWKETSTWTAVEEPSPSAQYQPADGNPGFRRIGTSRPETIRTTASNPVTDKMYYQETAANGQRYPSREEVESAWQEAKAQSQEQFLKDNPEHAELAKNYDSFDEYLESPEYARATGKQPSVEEAIKAEDGKAADTVFDHNEDMEMDDMAEKEGLNYEDGQGKMAGDGLANGGGAGVDMPAPEAPSVDVPAADAPEHETPTQEPPISQEQAPAKEPSQNEAHEQAGEPVQEQVKETVSEPAEEAAPSEQAPNGTPAQEEAQMQQENAAPDTPSPNDAPYEPTAEQQQVWEAQDSHWAQQGYSIGEDPVYGDDPRIEITNKFDPQTVHVETAKGISGEFHLSSDGSVTIEADSIKGAPALSDSDKITMFREDPAVKDAILKAQASDTMVQYQGGEYKLMKNIEVRTPEGVQRMDMTMDMETGEIDLYTHVEGRGYIKLQDGPQDAMMQSPEMQTVQGHLEDCREALLNQEAQIRDKIGGLEGLDSDAGSVLEELKMKPFVPDVEYGAYIREPIAVPDILEAGDSILSTPDMELTQGLEAMQQANLDQYNALIEFLSSPMGSIAAIAAAIAIIAAAVGIANKLSNRIDIVHDQNKTMMDNERDAEYERLKDQNQKEPAEKPDKSQPELEEKVSAMSEPAHETMTGTDAKDKPADPEPGKEQEDRDEKEPAAGKVGQKEDDTQKVETPANEDRSDKADGEKAKDGSEDVGKNAADVPEEPDLSEPSDPGNHAEQTEPAEEQLQGEEAVRDAVEMENVDEPSISEGSENKEETQDIHDPEPGSEPDPDGTTETVQEDELVSPAMEETIEIPEASQDVPHDIPTEAEQGSREDGASADGTSMHAEEQKDGDTRSEGDTNDKGEGHGDEQEPPVRDAERNAAEEDEKRMESEATDKQENPKEHAEVSEVQEEDSPVLGIEDELDAEPEQGHDEESRDPAVIAAEAKSAAGESLSNEKARSGVISYEIDKESGALILGGDISAKGVQRVLEAAEEYARNENIRLNSLVIGPGAEHVDINALQLVDAGDKDRTSIKIDTIAFEADKRAYEGIEKAKANVFVMPDSVQNLFFKGHVPEACYSMRRDKTFRDFNIIAFQDCKKVPDGFMQHGHVNMLLQKDTIPGHSMEIGKDSFGNRKGFVGEYIRARDNEEKDSPDDTLTRKQKVERDGEPVRRKGPNMMASWSSVDKEGEEKAIESVSKVMNRDRDSEIRAVTEARDRLVAERNEFVRTARNTVAHVAGKYKESDEFAEKTEALKARLNADMQKAFNGVRGTIDLHSSTLAKEQEALRTLAERLKDDETKAGKKALAGIQKYIDLGKDNETYHDYKLEERKKALDSIIDRYAKDKVLYDYLQSDAGKARLEVCDDPTRFGVYKDLTAAIEKLDGDLEGLRAGRIEVLSAEDRKIVDLARENGETVNGLRVSKAGEGAFENHAQRLLVNDDMRNLADRYMKTAEACTDEKEKAAYENMAKDILRGKVFVAVNGVEIKSYAYANCGFEGLVQDCNNHISLEKETASYKKEMERLENQKAELVKEGKDTTQIDKTINEKRIWFKGLCDSLAGPNASRYSILEANSFASQDKLHETALASPSQADSIVRNSGAYGPTPNHVTNLSEKGIEAIPLRDLDQERMKYEHDVRVQDMKTSAGMMLASAFGNALDGKYTIGEALKDCGVGMIVLFAKIGDWFKEARKMKKEWNTNLEGKKFGFLDNIQKYYDKKFPDISHTTETENPRLLKEMALARDAVASMAVLDIAMPGASDSEKAKLLTPVLNKQGEAVGIAIPVNSQMQELKQQIAARYELDTIIRKCQENREGDQTAEQKKNNFLDGLKKNVDRFDEMTHTPGARPYSGLNEAVKEKASEAFNKDVQAAEKRADKHEEVKAKQEAREKARKENENGRKPLRHPRTDAMDPRKKKDGKGKDSQQNGKPKKDNRKKTGRVD